MADRSIRSNAIWRTLERPNRRISARFVPPFHAFQPKAPFFVSYRLSLSSLFLFYLGTVRTIEKRGALPPFFAFQPVPSVPRSRTCQQLTLRLWPISSKRRLRVMGSLPSPSHFCASTRPLISFVVTCVLVRTLVRLAFQASLSILPRQLTGLSLVHGRLVRSDRSHPVLFFFSCQDAH